MRLAVRIALGLGLAGWALTGHADKLVYERPGDVDNNNSTPGGSISVIELERIHLVQ